MVVMNLLGFFKQHTVYFHMLKFATGGFPHTTKNRSVFNAIARIKELGLDAMELEFVYSDFVDKDTAPDVKKTAEDEGVALTVHGSYFVNLASPEKPKWHASINRVIKSAEIGDLCGAQSVTFHAAAFQKRTEDEVYPLVKSAFEKIFEEYHKRGLSITVAPELTGKAAQWGDLEPLIKLVQDFPDENIAFCFDFAHKHARDGGGWNSAEEFNEMLTLISKELGKEFLSNMHMHVSGIQYGEKGEKNHLTYLSSEEAYKKEGVDVGDLSKQYAEFKKKSRLETPDLKWQELLTVLKEHEVGGVLVCESPNLEQDALLMKQYYDSI